MSPFVELTFEGPLARLTMKRADKLNALDRAMVDALAEAARAIEASRDARVAILSGEGKAFCAGGDIAAWGGLPALEMWRDWTRAGHRAFEALARLRVPLIAALTGHAFGGGLELAGGRGHPRCRKRDQTWPSRVRPRHGARLVGHPKTRAAIWTIGRTAHGPCGRNVYRGRGARARVGRRGDSRRAKGSRAPKKSPPTSPSEAPCGADDQGDDQFRRGRGSRRSNRRTGRRADRDD